MTIVALGSTSSLKRSALESALGALGILASISTVEAASQVRNQPLSNEETMRGAANRAQVALDKFYRADYGVGLEGGVHEYSFGMCVAGWAAVRHKTGAVAYGCSPILRLPVRMSKRIRDGEELGHIVADEAKRVGRENVDGAFDLLTNGLITRQKAFELAMYTAFAPLRNELYH